MKSLEQIFQQHLRWKKRQKLKSLDIRTQFSRQLVELTESSGGDGVSQVLASYRNSCDGHYNQNGMMTSGYTGWKNTFCDAFLC